MHHIILGIEVHDLRKKIAQGSEASDEAERQQWSRIRAHFETLLELIYDDLELMDNERKPESIPEDYELLPRARRMYSTNLKYMALTIRSRGS